MKMAELKKRLVRDRPMITVTLRMPEDVLADLKRVAPLLGYSGYQPLMRAYIGRGLREDMEKLDGAPIARLVEALRHQFVPDDKIARGIDELAAS